MLTGYMVHAPNAFFVFLTVQDDIATNTSAVDGRLCLAPVMSKTELRKGFAISAAVPFVKAGTLKVREWECHHAVPALPGGPAPYRRFSRTWYRTCKVFVGRRLDCR